MSIILDKEQSQVVEHSEGKIAVVAAPGSGKTRTLVERSNSLVKSKKAQFNEILLITFTEKSKLEIIERFDNVGFKPEIETFHSLAHKTISLYNSKHHKTKINIMNNSEDVLIDRISKYISDTYEDFLTNKLKIKEDFNLYSFDDLLVKFTELLEKNQSSLSNIKKIKYIMVDECQDLDIIQYNIINLINCNNLMLIGDLNQSIYGWRGAKLELFKTYYNNCDKCYHLSNNYRSGSEIVNISNQLIKNNLDRIEVDVNIINKNNSFSKIENFLNNEDQLTWMGENIRNLIKKNSKIAIILRCDYQKEEIVDYFKSENLKFNVLTNKYEELNDIISIYKSLNGSVLSIYQITNRLNFEIKDLNLIKISDKNALYIEETIKEINLMNTDIITKIMRVFDKLNFNSKVYHNNLESQYVISKILNIAKTKMIKQKRKYEDFGYILSTLTINSLILNDENNNKDYTIDIMTIHGSKGLEYDYVFIPDVNNNLLPHKKGIIEEERRLFYVGITRAKVGVYISSIKKSSFLSEI